MNSEREVFENAMDAAITQARLTGDRIFVLFPVIENQKLVVSIVQDGNQTAEQAQNIAFTIYPTGQIMFGNSAKYAVLPASARSSIMCGN